MPSILVFFSFLPAAYFHPYFHFHWHHFSVTTISRQHQCSRYPMPLKQHCRLSICSHFGWVWQILSEALSEANPNINWAGLSNATDKRIANFIHMLIVFSSPQHDHCRQQCRLSICTLQTVEMKTIGPPPPLSFSWFCLFKVVDLEISSSMACNTALAQIRLTLPLSIASGKFGFGKGGHF